METEDYLENLLDYASAPIIVWNPDFKISRFNHAFERLTGYTVKEVIGQELSMLFTEEKKEESIQKISRTLSGERWKSVEIPISCKNKEMRTVLWNSANIYEQDSKVLLGTIAQGIE